MVVSLLYMLCSLLMYLNVFKYSIALCKIEVKGEF
jgi:hypothetical protein